MNVTQKNVVVFDLDNCLAEDASRMHLIPGADAHGAIAAVEGLTGAPARAAQVAWHPYHQAAARATPHHQDDVLLAALALPKDGWLLFLTARPETFAAETARWLRHHGYLAHRRCALLMRRPDCAAPSPVMKLRRLGDWLDSQGMTFDNVVAVYDDRADVLEAFAAANVKTVRLFIQER